MKTLDIAIAVFVFMFVGIRLYQKYIRKDGTQPGQAKTSEHSSQFASNPKDDDYEPYSKK